MSTQCFTFIDQQGNILRAPANSFSILQVKAPGTAVHPNIQILLSTPTILKHVLWGSANEVRKIEIENNFKLSGSEKDRAETIKKATKLMFNQVVNTVLKENNQLIVFENNQIIDINKMWEETVEAEMLKKEEK